LISQLDLKRSHNWLVAKKTFESDSPDVWSPIFGGESKTCL
jgi:hypothetical protein